MKSANPVGYGIDFGTSNSAISVAYHDRVEVLGLGRARSSLTLPSFVYLHRSGRRAAGDLYEGHAYDFYKAIEAAKIALSDNEVVELRYPALDLSVTLRRGAFESMIRPELDLVRQAIIGALEEARIDAKEVDRVLLTGGSAYIPAFRAGLAETFGQERL